MQNILGRSGKIHIHDGYAFKLKINRGNSTYWLCKTPQCKTSLTLDENFSLKSVIGQHFHPSNPTEIKALSCVAEMKRRAQEELNTPIPDIYW